MLCDSRKHFTRFYDSEWWSLLWKQIGIFQFLKTSLLPRSENIMSHRLFLRGLWDLISHSASFHNKRIQAEVLKYDCDFLQKNIPTRSALNTKTLKRSRSPGTLFSVSNTLYRYHSISSTSPDGPQRIYYFTDFSNCSKCFQRDL